MTVVYQLRPGQAATRTEPRGCATAAFVIDVGPLDGARECLPVSWYASDPESDRLVIAITATVHTAGELAARYAPVSDAMTRRILALKAQAEEAGWSYDALYEGYAPQRLPTPPATPDADFESEPPSCGRR